MDLLIKLALAVHLCFLCTTVEGKKIILLPLHQVYNSRLMNMESIAEILSEEGHDVSMILNNRTGYSLKGAGYKVTIFDVPDSLPALDDEINAKKFRDHNPYSLYGFYESWFVQTMIPWCRVFVEQRDFLQKLKNEKFDLLIFDIADDCGRIIVDYLDIPSIGFSNYGFSSQTNIFFPTYPSFMPLPEFELISGDHLDFLSRCINHFAFIMSWLIQKWVFADFDALRISEGLNTSLSVEHSLDRSLIFATVNFAFDYLRPVMPHVILLPGLLREPKGSLGKDWQEWLDKETRGVVVVSFGTTLHDWTDYADQAAMFNRVLGQLPYSVIWRITAGAPRTVAKNIRIVGWMPQNAILTHKNVRAFVTHAGISATYEAINNSLPVLCFPIFVDQYRNADLMSRRNKMGLVMNLKEFTEIEMKDKLDQVLHNESFRLSAKLTTRLIKDTPLNARQTLIWWTDYVLRYGGASHLTESPARNLSMLQFTGIDVLLAVALFIVFVFLVLIGILGFFRRVVRRIAKRDGEVECQAVGAYISRYETE